MGKHAAKRGRDPNHTCRAVAAGRAGKTPISPRQVAEVIRKQVQIGISCVGDGEFWNDRNFAYYGQQFTGVTTRALRPGELATARQQTRERDTFPRLYADMDRAGTMFCVPGEEPRFFPTTKMVANGPIQGRATDAIKREVKVFSDALKAADGAEEAFICVFAPGWLDHHIFNEHYATDEEFMFAVADALRDEYRAVIDAGFILQIDDPGVADAWDMIKPEPSIAEYRRHRKSASMPSITRSPASRRIVCATISAGAPGMARIRTTCR